MDVQFSLLSSKMQFHERTELAARNEILARVQTLEEALVGGP
jgi:hypothetical protein